MAKLIFQQVSIECPLCQALRRVLVAGGGSDSAPEDHLEFSQ